MEKLQKSDAEWRAELTPEQYEVLRNKGTERAFTGAYVDDKTGGMYRCAGCGQELFSSWPQPAQRYMPPVLSST